MAQRRALGRGLGSLIPEAGAQAPATSVPAVAAPETERSTAPYQEIDLDRIDPNPVQPRHRFRQAELDELAASIGQHGIVQPILVRRRGDRYQVIAGERRLRAAQRAGLRKIPVVLREIPDDQMLEVALVENIQRQELDPIDEALAYRAGLRLRLDRLVDPLIKLPLIRYLHQPRALGHMRRIVIRLTQEPE